MPNYVVFLDLKVEIYVKVCLRLFVLFPYRLATTGTMHYEEIIQLESKINGDKLRVN